MYSLIRLDELSNFICYLFCPPIILQKILNNHKNTLIRINNQNRNFI